MILSRNSRWLVLFFLVIALHAEAQYSYKGIVTDAETGDPVPFASVGLSGVNSGGTTNFQGVYSFQSKVAADSLFVSSIGYNRRVKFVPRIAGVHTTDFQLTPSSSALSEVKVYSGENPAFRILRSVQANKNRNDRIQLTAYEFDSYAKMELDVDNISEKFKEKKVMRDISSSVKKFEQQAGDDGKLLIPTYITETVSKFYYLESPRRRREHIIKTNIKGVGVGEGGVISQLVGGNLVANYNFYQNFITFFGKDFASPIGEQWKQIYRYYLQDTVKVGGRICYQIEFEPKNPADLTYTGQMWIDTTHFALTQIDVTVGKAANLNFIEKVKISQELDQTSEGVWMPSRTRFLVDLEEISKGSAGMLLKMYISNKDFVLNKPHPLSFYDRTSEVAEDARESTPDYWKNARHESLSRQDLLAFSMIDSVKSVPAVRTYVEIADVVVGGFRKFDDMDVGPYISGLAINQIEGARVRLGFRTNAQFDSKWIFRGHASFGTKDLIPKYSGEVNYLFSKSKWTVAGIRHSYDLERVGLTPEQIGDNKLFYAFTRWGSFSGAFFRRDSEAFFSTEFIRGFRLTGSMNMRSFDPLFRFQYRLQPELGADSPVQDHYNETFITLEARFAKNETFILNGNEKVTLATRRIPVITFRYQQGFKGLLGGDFNYHRFTIKAYQTFRVGKFGRSDYTLSAGYTPSNLPAPLLFPHLGNETFMFVRSAFSTMNYFEFVSDRFASLQFNHNFEGLLFNRIPLIKKLKWRFIVSTNVLYGSQRSSNRALMQEVNRPLASRYTDRYDFDSLDPKKAFVEVGYGIDNIFKLFRLQAFHRLSYLDHGNPDLFRLMGSINFHF